MDDDRIVISSSAAIAPEAVAGKGFTTGLRGYQPAEVRQFLNRVAEEMAAAAGREAELRRLLHETQARAAHPELDEAVLTASLGEHAGRLIASARETAAAITAEAERTAAAILRDAEYRIARMRQEADNLMARRVEEADGVSASLRQSAEADARAVRDQAQAEAEAAVQAARSHGKEMVAEARAVRERMLGDLSRRRRVAEVQLEQLRVARERLVEAYDVVRRTLEEVTAELNSAEPEARLAAEAVGRRMAESDPPPLPRPPDPPPRPSPLDIIANAARRFDPPGRGADAAAGRPGMAVFDPAPAPAPAPADSAFGNSGSVPIVPPTPPVPAPARPGSYPTEPDGGDRNPVPPGWIERAGGSGAASPGRSSMPPSVAGGGGGAPLLVPAAGIGGGPPAPGAADEPDPSDPGTWLGAGFGPPRHPVPTSSSAPGVSSSPSESPPTPPLPGSSPPGLSAPPAPPTAPSPSEPPSDPSSGSSRSSSRAAGSLVGAGPRSPFGSSTSPFAPPGSTSGPSGGAPSAPSAPSTGSAPRGSTWLASTSGLTPTAERASGGPAAVAPTALPQEAPPAPTRPPLRPQTVADSLAVRPTPTPTPPGIGMRPVPPDLPLEVPSASPEQPPELATAESPAVADEQHRPAQVEELFARIRDEAPSEAEAPRAAPAAPAGPSDEVVDESALSRRDQQLDTLDADLTRALKRILQDEQNEVLERLREGGRAGASASVLSALDQQTAGFRAAAADALAAAYQAGGGGADDANAVALGTKLADDLAAPLRERLERVVTAAGDDVEELAESVRAAYRQAKLHEIELLVRHHTAAAHALGAFVATSDGTLLRWVVDDEGPCPDCDDNALAGPTAKGEPFPTGQRHPPAHLGCRCLLVPAT